MKMMRGVATCGLLGRALWTLLKAILIADCTPEGVEGVLHASLRPSTPLAQDKLLTCTQFTIFVQLFELQVRQDENQ